MENEQHKVFCIGWHKTGTTTMGEALLLLGYNIVGARLDLAETLLKGQTDDVIKEAEKYDAFQDVPWAALYKELDKSFPKSKFIFTRRDEDKWLKSASNHFSNLDIPLHQWLYGEGVLEGNENLYLNRYRQHNHEVMTYFDGRDDFLVLDLFAGEGWDKLCAFLGKDIPKTPFPFANKGKHNLNTKEKIIQFVKSLLPKKVRKRLPQLLGKSGMKPDRFNNKEQNAREIEAIYAKRKR